MTLATARTRLEIATKQGNTDEMNMWESRIARKLLHEKYATTPKPTPETTPETTPKPKEKSDAKKSKR